MPRQLTANDIINRAAVEVGLYSEQDPVASTDESFFQLVQLLNAAGQELVEYYPWQVLTQTFIQETSAGDSGEYDLPPDYAYMMDQTGWERTNSQPLGGPMSAQDWTYIKGSDLASQTIHASFRLDQNLFKIFPQPPPEGLIISFEYISRNWVTEQSGGFKDAVTLGTDIVVYEPILIIKFLKAKFLEAKGFDATVARMDFENMFNSRTGKDNGAPILNAARASRGYPYLHPYRNTGDTGYGL